MSAPAAAVYGTWDEEVAPVPAGAVQVSPTIPGSAALESLESGTLDAVSLLAPPGTGERRFVLAHALRVLRPGGALTALAPKFKGGTRLRAELEAFGCRVTDEARRHHRICTALRPEEPDGVADAIAAGAPQFLPDLGLWTQPGLFSHDRLDPGSALLARTLPDLKGRGADLGCGLGILAHRVLASPAVTALALVDIDRRAVDCSRRNVDDPRASVAWADIRTHPLERLDFVVSNPPFHAESGQETKALGQAFLGRAAAALRNGGTAWIVANRHLPYEETLRGAFKRVETDIEESGFKVFEARR